MIPATSAGSFETAHCHVPKPPCWFTALTHSSRNSRLVLSCWVSCPFVSRTRYLPFLAHQWYHGFKLSFGCTKTPIARSHYTPDLRTRPVHIVFCMVCILAAYILLHNIPSSSLQVLHRIPSVIIATSPVNILPLYFGANTI
jgi:hypothetical protein